MTPPTGFSIDVDHNEYLAEGDTVVDAVVTVTCHTDPEPTGTTAGGLAQVIMIDCSGSMTGSRIAEAKRATRAVIESLPDGVRFAVVAGATLGTMAYPATYTTAVAGPQTRAEASRAVNRLTAGGGTAMGTWLRTAHRLLADAPTEVKHALLLTDGFNQHESLDTLTETLDACQGTFVCDACGIGKDWHGSEIRLIADRMLGEASGLPEESDWKAGFARITQAAMRKTIGDLTLRIFTPARNEIRFIKQMNPSIVDLTDRRREHDAKTGDYPTGAWGTETREFHIQVAVPPIRPHDDRLAARISVLAGTTELARDMITARWTGDTMLSTRLNPKVAHYTGQAELADRIQEGVAAAKAGDTDTATLHLGEALRLADQAGNEHTAKLLGRLVHVDPDTGTARINSHARSVDLEMADVASVKTVTVRRDRRTEDPGGDR
ncbi:von Willebrand factor type A domain-containing protein [Stackebrandtia albiflava]|uniref:von Willebrand factor type A domain-containing protein n=1 Tax=Stackebrandtia albiflava TaxID=406432 RepID=A0A562VBD4_9ACTN|nr:VWA domain-containing protein [Stackebrandtia albiflava]TWJ15170.1 von Willebrand factor type A domain-containing protein [Stackebrandtia albiflava]